MNLDKTFTSELYTSIMSELSSLNSIKLILESVIIIYQLSFQSLVMFSTRHSYVAVVYS